MRAFTFVVMSSFVGLLYAQDLPPELAGPAGKYRAAVEALEKQRLAEAGRAAQAYAGTLDQVGKAATAKGEVKVIEAAAKERAAALAGALPPELPTDLPALRLQGTRKALLVRQEKINADAAAQKKRFDGQYLGILAALAAKAGPESALGKQVAAEREAVLAGGKAAEGGGDAKEVKVARGKNVVVNGDFEKVGADGSPEGWRSRGKNVAVLVLKEKGNSFLRIESQSVGVDGTAPCCMVSQDVVDIPVNAKSSRVSVRLRTTECKLPKKPNSDRPRIGVNFYDEIGNGIFHFGPCWNEKNGEWADIQTEALVPKGTKKFEVYVFNGNCPGLLDFDDIEVTFQ